MADEDKNAESAEDITAAVMPITINMATHDGVKYLIVNGSISSCMFSRSLVIFCDWSIGVVMFVVMLELLLLLLVKINLQSMTKINWIV